MLNALDLPEPPESDGEEVGSATDHTAARPAKPPRRSNRTHALSAIVAIVGSAAIALVWLDRQRTATADAVGPPEPSAELVAAPVDEAFQPAVSKPAAARAEVPLPAPSAPAPNGPEPSSPEPSASTTAAAPPRPVPKGTWQRPSADPKPPPLPLPPPPSTGKPWERPDRFGK
jgi:hypothetical protein